MRICLPEQELNITLVSDREWPMFLFDAEVDEQCRLFHKDINPDELLSFSSFGDFDMYISDAGNVKWRGPGIIHSRITKT